MTLDFFHHDTDDDEDEHRDAPRPETVATAYDLLPAMLLQDALTADQLGLVMGEGCFCLAVLAPTVEWTEPIFRAISSISDWEFRHVKAAPPRSRTATDDGVSRQVVRTLAGGGRVLAVAPDIALLPASMRTASDLTVTLAPPTASQIARAVEALTGSHPGELHEDVEGLGFEQLVACLRVGSSAAECTERLSRVARSAKISDSLLKDAPELSQLAGYGEAMDWAVQLVDDLGKWRRGTLPFHEIQASVILSSKPGLGKNTLVKAIAKTAGVPLISTSVADWFATSSGYLDGVIKSLDDVFERARAAAPCLVYLDEIDALPSRSLDSRNRDFWLPVITRMLTVLDGSMAETTDRLIIVAATNHPEMLEPALLRHGRFGRLIEIRLPDEPGLAGIFRHHLGNDLHDMDMTSVARLAIGSSGADVAGFVKSARTSARAKNRSMTASDLLESVAPPDPRSPDHLKRTALHEAGHALVAHLLGLGRVRSISIIAKGVGGGFCHVDNDGYAPTRGIVEDHVVQMLSGRAAEEVLLGDQGTGSGGHSRSDLATATREVGLLHLGLGLGDDLIYRADREEVPAVLRLDPELSRRVEHDLRRLYSRALELVRQNEPMIRTLADELLVHRQVDGDRFLQLVAFQDGFHG